MTRSQAIKVYIKGHVYGEETIRRLIHWNPKLSIPENARALKLHNDTIRPFVKQYGLKYMVCGQGNNPRGVNKNASLR